MKILLIHNYYRYYGGEETYIDTIKYILKKNGHTVLLYKKQSKNIKNVFHKILAGINLIWNQEVNNELSKIIGEYKPDIVQFQNIFPLIAPSSYWIFSKHHIPIVQRISNYRFLCPKSILFRSGKICELCVKKHFFFPSILYRCYNNSTTASLLYSFAFFLHKYIFKSFSLIDAYIFPSKFTMKYISDFFPIDKKRIFHLPTPVNVPNCLPKNIININKKYFVYVGRIAEEKGVLDLINIFISEPYSNMHLVLIGDGPDKDRATQKAYGKKNITFKNHINKSILFNIMSHAVGIIIPAKWFDIQPNVVLEALSLKIPVIAPNTHNFKEILINNSEFLYNTDVQLKKIITHLWYANPRIVRKKIVLPIVHDSYIHYKKLMNLYSVLLRQKRECKIE